MCGRRRWRLLTIMKRPRHSSRTVRLDIVTAAAELETQLGFKMVEYLRSIELVEAQEPQRAAGGVGIPGQVTRDTTRVTPEVC